ncbi:GATA zinc finger domain-containing protein 14-like [Chelonus insularis]|uniref:GATA zinc finger domain-containing protein 14-like n=1 Tax=Chelonus insularis TaxID=460826 RepID=UPI00158C7AC7|nr:GATA zinc finger domain-containing protein 14-like [Chelonus insularis]
MALSKVQNFTSILGNNASEIIKLESGINMYDSPGNLADNRCNEYNPWSYDLMNRNTNHKMPLDDEETQDLNNSMVNDLVSKILDDEPIINEQACYINHYNGNSVYSQREIDNYHIKSNGNYHANYVNNNANESFNQTLPNYQKPNLFGQEIDSQYKRDLIDVYNGLEDLCLNDYAIRNDRRNDYPNHKTIDSMKKVINSNDYSINYNPVNDMPRFNCDLPQPTNNWNETLNSDYNDDIFENYSRLPTPNNFDLNFNTIMPPLHEPEILQTDMSTNLATSAHMAPLMNTHDTYNAINCTSYHRPGSAMTDFSGDSGFLSNSSHQHYSPADSTLQQNFVNNYQRNYEEIHQNSILNAVNLQMPQQNLVSGRGFRVESKQFDQNYKSLLLNRNPGLNEYAGVKIETNDPNSYMLNQKIDENLMKMLSPQLKTKESLRYNSKNSQNSSTMDQMKFNYQIDPNYQRFTASNSENLKSLSQTHVSSPPPYYTNGVKRLNSGCSYPIDTYERTPDINFTSNNHLAHQIARASMDSNVFNQIMLKQQQQLHRIPLAPDVLLNARLMRGIGTGAAGNVFSAVPLSSLHSVSVLTGAFGPRVNVKSSRRAGPSSVLHLRLEQTFDQFKQLEKERKKCEAGLAAHFPGKRVTSANNIPIPRLQGNPSRADRLIIDHLREHARVITLIAKMEHLRGVNMSERVHKAMEIWLESIKFVQECRKKEITHASKRQKENPHCTSIHDDKDILVLANSIRELTKASRLARTAMFNAMQATLLHDKDFEKKIIDTSKDVALLLVDKEEDIESSNVADNTENNLGNCSTTSTSILASNINNNST